MILVQRELISMWNGDEEEVAVRQLANEAWSSKFGWTKVWNSNEGQKGGRSKPADILASYKRTWLGLREC